jgi:hypothetical protein
MSLVHLIEEMGNPFNDKGDELYVLDSHIVCNRAVVESMRDIEALGQEQYTTFVNDRLINCTVAVNATITRNKLALFKNVGGKPKVLLNSKLVLANSDCSLFSKLYIARQTRSGDLDMFFNHENQPNPPALNAAGNLRFGSKSDLLSCLESVANISGQECPTVNAIVLDGAAIEQMLDPNQCKTFCEYATKVFIPSVKSHLNRMSRLDLVWDQYISSSLKATARVKRGSGSRRKVLPSADLARNWAEFLHNDDNKTELFNFLSDTLQSLCVTDGK